MINTIALISFAPGLAAAGWAALVWLFSGSFGLALVVFVVLKMFRK